MFRGAISGEVAERIRLLQDRIDEHDIPSSKLDESLNVATWNVRDFGKGKTPRRDDSILYIAEIFNRFDLVALVELRDNVSDLMRVMQVLGPYWRFVMSDFRKDAGNSERIAYVYDKRMVTFTGLAAEADPPRVKNAQTKKWEAEYEWWRSPYMASFRAGNFDFVLLTVHMRWGTKPGRLEALKNLGDWIKKRVRQKVVDEDFIVMGDFNIPKIGDKYYNALAQNFLKMPEPLGDVAYTNIAGARGSRKRNYDQILHVRGIGKNVVPRGGVLDFARDGLMANLLPDVPEKKQSYELSDHLPLWIQLDTDVDGERLDSLIRRSQAGARAG